MPQRRRRNFVPHAFFFQKGVKAGPGVFVGRWHQRRSAKICCAQQQTRRRFFDVE
jgi:hypothetical protein